MLLLLPPSEGKTAPARGRPLDLSALSFPSLAATRTAVLKALEELALGDVQIAQQVLGLSAGQLAEVALDTRLRSAPCTRVGRLYTGVLYDALDLSSLPLDARRRASRTLLVFSALFGVLRLSDSVPGYRLSGNVTLPGLGSVAGLWRDVLDVPMAQAAGRGLIVDLRSTMYAGMWRPSPDLARQTLTVRVLHERSDGSRSVVSHFNKATKGQLVRALLLDGASARDPDTFAGVCERLGYVVELTSSPRSTSARLDIVTTD